VEAAVAGDMNADCEMRNAEYTGNGLTGRLRRYATIYAAMWKNSVIREMGFKFNFIMWIIVEMLWFALQLTFVNVLYLHTESIATWGKWEVVLLFGASHFIQQIYTALFLTNVTQLSELIRTGRLDFLLLLPANSRFLISCRNVDLGGFVNAASAVGVMVFALVKLGTVPGAWQVAGFLVLCVLGVLIHYSLMFMLASISFWAVRAQGIVWAYYNLFNIARLPDAAFRGLFKAFFTFAIPMLLVSNVPAKLLADKLGSPVELAALVGMAVVCVVVSELVWRQAVKHYTSASS
jgi:ABC-2 type transport system permease protein